MPDRNLDVVAYRALHQPLSPLFLDYLSGSEAVRPFLGPGRLDLAGVAEGAEQALRLDRPAAAVAEALARQQDARGAERRNAREPWLSPGPSLS
jgi:hypothetical protein